MRFESLALERYGAFADRLLTFRPDAHVHVVHGRNEAGKTSALAAIADLLFGFGKRTPYNFRHESKTLRIGASLRLDGGATLPIRRRKGDSNTLLDAGERPLGDDALLPHLGPVTRDLFLSEFGLSAEMLRKGGAELMRAGGRLAESLAAGSAGLSTLLEVRREVDETSKSLFAPRHSAKREFSNADTRYKTASQRLKDAIITAEAWKAAVEAEVTAAERSAALRVRLAELGREVARHERVRRTLPRLAEIDRLRRALATFADLPEPSAEAVGLWRRTIESEAASCAKLAELDAAEARSQARIEGLAVDERLLAAGLAIDALRERIGEVNKAGEDLPRRLEARRGALELLRDDARRLGLASSNDLVGHEPSDTALARVRDFADRGRRSLERRREAEEEWARARRAHEDLAPERPEGDLADPASVRRRLAALETVPADAERLRRELAAVEADERHLGEAAAALQPAVRPLAALAGRVMPDVEAIADAQGLLDAAAEEERRSLGAATTAEGRARQARREIDRLAAEGPLASRAELREARERRDALFVRLREAIAGETRAGDPRAALGALFSAAVEIDAITDRLLANAERTARRDAYEAQHRESQSDAEQAGAAAEAARQRRLQAANAWSALWKDSDIEPLAPPHMLRWRERLAGLLDRRRAIEMRRAECRALAARLEAHRTSLDALAREQGLCPEGAAPDILYRAVEQSLGAAESAWRAAHERQAAYRAAGNALREAQRRLDREREEEASWRSAWPAAVAVLGLPSSAGILEAEAALAVWQSVPVHRASFERENRSVTGIERDLAAFAHDVAVLTRDVASDLAGRAPRDALATLAQRLEAARKAADERTHLRDDADERCRIREPLLHRQAAERDTLAQARRELALDREASLAPTLARLEERLSLRDRLAAVTQDLRVSEDLDAEGARSEQDGLALPLIDETIEDLKRRQAELHGELVTAGGEWERAKAQRAAFEAGRDADLAAADKAEAASDLVDISERWLVQAAASKLATLAIDRHRAAVQDPLIARASGMFALVTGGAFSGLAMQFDEKDIPILVARRDGGADVGIEGLSEGTRDQLFLVLRLALLERRSGESLPFIGDDLLASFDDRRTGQALDLLGEFGRGRQVILFTHHDHVVRIARERLADVADVITL